MTVRDNFLREQAEIEKAFNGGKSYLTGDGIVRDSAEGLYLSNGLQYIDPKLYKPMYRYFALRDMPHKMVGGIEETAAFFKANYSTNSLGGSLASGNNNVVTTIKAQLEKKTTRISPRMYQLQYGYIDTMKAQRIGFDIMGLFDEGVRHSYNIEKDNIAYNGLIEYSLNATDKSFGLINNPDVPTTNATAKFETATGVQIVSDLVSALLATYNEVAYDPNYLPDRLLVYPSLYSKLLLPLVVVGDAGATATTGVSTLEYVKKALSQAIPEEDNEIAILPLPYLEGKGANHTGRLVLYKYDEEIVRMPVAMDLTRGATLLDPSDQQYKTTYVAFIGEPQFIKPTAIRYIENHA